MPWTNYPQWFEEKKKKLAKRKGEITGLIRSCPPNDCDVKWRTTKLQPKCRSLPMFSLTWLGRAAGKWHVEQEYSTLEAN